MDDTGLTGYMSPACIQAFIKWFDELEGFSVREERFWNAVDRQDRAELFRWLTTAFRLGYDSGFDRGRRLHSVPSEVGDLGFYESRRNPAFDGVD